MIADVADETRVVQIVDEVVARLGRLDVLVNDAAIQVEARLHEHTTAFHAIVATNLYGTFLFSRAALRPECAPGPSVTSSTCTSSGPETRCCPCTP